MRILLLTGLLSITACAMAGQPPQAGSAAPDFRLQDQNGEWHSLEDYSGEWLAVYFYPKDDTPGCTKEACNFRDNIYSFRAIGAHVVADVGGETAKAYGVLRDYKLTQIASRQSFIVGPDGLVARHYADVDPETHTQEVLADLQELMGES